MTAPVEAPQRDALLFQPSMAGGIVVVFDSTGSMTSVAQQLGGLLSEYVDKVFGDGFREGGVVWMDEHYPERYHERYDGGYQDRRRLSKLRQGKDEKYIENAGLSHKPWYGATHLIAGKTNSSKEMAAWLRVPPNGHGFGDGPEAVACSVAAARKLMPKATIWLVTDSPAHGCGAHIAPNDSYPNGCPCGVELDLTNTYVLFVHNYHSYKTGPDGFNYVESSMAEHFERAGGRFLPLSTKEIYDRVEEGIAHGGL